MGVTVDGKAYVVARRQNATSASHCEWVDHDVQAQQGKGCPQTRERLGASSRRQLHVAGHGLLGNQLMHALSAAVLASELSRKTHASVACEVHLSVPGGNAALQHAMPGVAEALLPCVLTAARNDSARGTRVREAGLRAKPLTLQAVQEAWRRSGAQVLDAPQECFTAGAFRLAEMPQASFWRAARSRAALLAPVTPDNRHGAAERQEVCLHLRGRELEPHGLRKEWTVEQSRRSPQGQRIAHSRGAALQLAERVWTSAAAVARSAHNGARAVSVATPRRELLWHARNSTALDLRSMRAEGRAKQPYSDLLALSRCAVLLPEEPPTRGTFTLLAAFIGGLRPCAALARAVGAPQPWRVLCRDEARLLGRPVTAMPPPPSHGDAAANECQSLGRVADLQSRLA